MKFEESRFDESSDTIRPLRKRIYYNDVEGADILIAEEQLHSDSPRAKVLSATTLEFTWPEVEWLWRSLGDLLEKAATPMNDVEGMQRPEVRDPPPIMSAFDMERQLSLFEDK